MAMAKIRSTDPLENYPIAFYGRQHINHRVQTGSHGGQRQAVLFGSHKVDIYGKIIEHTDQNDLQLA